MKGGLIKSEYKIVKNCYYYEIITYLFAICKTWPGLFLSLVFYTLCIY